MAKIITCLAFMLIFCLTACNQEKPAEKTANPTEATTEAATESSESVETEAVKGTFDQQICFRLPAVL